MDIVFIVIGINVNFIFLFKRDCLLQSQSFNSLLILNFFLFVLTYIPQYFLIDLPATFLALKIPFLSQLVFKVLLIFFRMLYKRDPLDSFWTNDLDLMKDGIFNLLFWVIGNIVPIIIVFVVLK
jgi:hypothetical protein